MYSSQQEAPLVSQSDAVIGAGESVKSPVTSCTNSPSISQTEGDKTSNMYFSTDEVVCDRKTHLNECLVDQKSKHDATKLEISDPNKTLGDIHCEV